MEALNYNFRNSFYSELGEIIRDHSVYTVTDSLGRIEYASIGYCGLLEINPNLIIGENHDLLKSHLHVDKIYKKLWRSIKMGKKWNGVLSDVSAKGNVFYVDTTIVPVKDNIDKSTRYLAIYKDVTEFYLQKLEVEDKNNKYLSFFNTIPFHVFTITKQGKILSANKKCFNKEPVKLINTFVFDHFGRQSLELIRENIEKARSKKEPQQFDLYDVNSKFVKKLYSILISPNINDLGGIESLSMTFYEMNKVKGISEKVLDNEAKFRTIYRSIDVGIIVVTDSRGTIAEWNKGAEKAFGYTESEIIGKSLIYLISKRFRKSNFKELMKAVGKIKANQNEETIEMYCLRKNGEEFPVEFALSHTEINGKGVFCAMMLDISKRKQLQFKLNQKKKDIELFLYRSAHDLKAPFTSAQGLINLLKEEYKSEKSIEIINMLESTINSGATLSTSLAEASSISARKYEFKKIDFSKTIKKVLETLSGVENFNQITFHTDIEVDRNFRSKPELINSVFQNLIQNAIKYSMPPRDNYKPTISIEVKSQNEEILISVSDNGPGINDKCLYRIFDLYYRCNHGNIPGNGLGLYIVKSIVDELKGTITVSNNLGSGACFKIKLPQSIKNNKPQWNTEITC